MGCHVMVAGNGDDLFRRLESLELWALDDAPLSSAVIKQLMRSCHHIKNVLFRGCDAVNDDLFAQLWRVSGPRPCPPLVFCFVSVPFFVYINTYIHTCIFIYISFEFSQDRTEVIGNKHNNIKRTKEKRKEEKKNPPPPPPQKKKKKKKKKK